MAQDTPPGFPAHTFLSDHLDFRLIDGQRPAGLSSGGALPFLIKNSPAGADSGSQPSQAVRRLSHHSTSLNFRT